MKWAMPILFVHNLYYTVYFHRNVLILNNYAALSSIKSLNKQQVTVVYLNNFFPKMIFRYFPMQCRKPKDFLIIVINLNQSVKYRQQVNDFWLLLCLVYYNLTNYYKAFIDTVTSTFCCHVTTLYCVSCASKKDVKRAFYKIFRFWLGNFQIMSKFCVPVTSASYYSLEGAVLIGNVRNK